MKRTTFLILLGLACLMVAPSLAQARYRDEMNLYQYVQSAPTVMGDPLGLFPESNYGQYHPNVNRDKIKKGDWYREYRFDPKTQTSKPTGT